MARKFLVWILIPAVAVTGLAGCESERRVLQRWPDTETVRTGETTLLDEPRLTSVGVQFEDDKFLIALEQDKTVQWKNQNCKVQYRVVRIVDPEHVDGVNKRRAKEVAEQSTLITIASALTFGLGLLLVPDAVEKGMKELREEKAKDREAVEEMMKDKDKVHIVRDSVAYVRELISRRKLSATSHRQTERVAAAGMLVRVRVGGTTVASGSTDDAGEYRCACWLDVPAKAGKASVQVQWGEQWKELARLPVLPKIDGIVIAPPGSHPPEPEAPGRKSLVALAGAKGVRVRFLDASDKMHESFGTPRVVVWNAAAVKVYGEALPPVCGKWARDQAIETLGKDLKAISPSLSYDDNVLYEYWINEEGIETP